MLPDIDGVLYRAFSKEMVCALIPSHLRSLHLWTTKERTRVNGVTCICSRSRILLNLFRFGGAVRGFVEVGEHKEEQDLMTNDPQDERARVIAFDEQQQQ
jgi:hypothetical protein